MSISFTYTARNSSGYVAGDDITVGTIKFKAASPHSGTSYIRYKITDSYLGTVTEWTDYISGSSHERSAQGILLSDFPPNSNKLTWTVAVNYYNSNKTKLGSETGKYTMTAPSWAIANYNPVSVSIVEKGAPAAFGYVKGLSGIKYDFNIKPAKGTYITRFTVTCTALGISMVSNNTSTTKNAEFSGSMTSGALNKAGTFTFTTKATDGRGIITTSSRDITVNEYTQPSITSLGGFRCDSNNLQTTDGKYFRISFKSSFCNLNTNTGKYKIETKKFTDDYWNTEVSNVSYTNGATITTRIGGSYEYEPYQVRVTASDLISSTMATCVVADNTYIIDINSDGTSIAFGGTASEESDIMDVSHNIRGQKAIFTGGKQGYNDGMSGVYLGKDGTIHLSGAQTKQGISFHYNNATSGYRSIYANNSTDIETDAGNFNCTGHLRANGGLFSGGKTAWGANTEAGAVISDQGGIMLTSDSSTSYPGINFQYNKSSGYPSIVSEAAGQLTYRASNGHKFSSGNILLNGNLIVGNNKTGAADGESGSYFTNGGKIYLTGNSSSYPTIVFYPDNGTTTNTLIDSSSSANMRLRADSTIRLQTERINTDANALYLGYNDAQEKNIHFSGSQSGAKHQAKIYGGNQSSTTSLGVYDGQLGITVAAYTDGYNSSGSLSGQPSLTINSSVNFKATGTVSSSDARLKENIHDLDDRYSVLFDNLKFKTFKYKTGNRQWTGLIAQELKEALDIAQIPTEEFAGYVEYNLDPDEDKDIWNGYADEKGVRYEQLIAVIGNELQKEKAYSRALEERLAQIEQKLNNQEA